MKYLLQNGAQINVQDNVGNTPLMYAVEKDSISMVETLLKYEPDMVIKNQKGKEAYRLAMSKEIKDLIQQKVIEHRRKQATQITLQQAQLRQEQEEEKEKLRILQQKHQTL